MSENRAFEVSARGEAGTGNQVLTFLLDGEEYGVDILCVQEIRGWEKPTKVPSTPSYVRGVINIRGSIVPIVDLRERFGLAACEPSPTTVVIVLRAERAGTTLTTGIVVDAVSEVYTLDEQAVKPPPDFGTAAESRFARGLATVDQKMLILLGTDQLLSAQVELAA